jgi:hypothetical protein
MKARELAVELTQLQAAEREQVLAELPAERRAELEVLMREVEELLQPPRRSFEAHLAKVRTQSHAHALSGLDEGRVRALLEGEHPAVQRRLASALRHRQLEDLAPAVCAIVTDYLRRQAQAHESRRPGLRARAGFRWMPWKRRAS